MLLKHIFQVMLSTSCIYIEKNLLICSDPRYPVDFSKALRNLDADVEESIAISTASINSTQRFVVSNSAKSANPTQSILFVVDVSEDPHEDSYDDLLQSFAFVKNHARKVI